MQFKDATCEVLKQVKKIMQLRDIRREIIVHIERERLLVEGNRELIQIYEEKIRKVVERVWEGWH